LVSQVQGQAPWREAVVVLDCEPRTRPDEADRLV
jgi:hypothetical protein